MPNVAPGPRYAAWVNNLVHITVVLTFQCLLICRISTCFSFLFFGSEMHKKELMMVPCLPNISFSFMLNLNMAENVVITDEKILILRQLTFTE